MNAQKRKELQKALGLIEKAKEIIENVREAEQDAFDNIPEGLQSSERGEKMEEYITNLENSESDCENIIDQLTDTIES